LTFLQETVLKQAENYAPCRSTVD